MECKKLRNLLAVYILFLGPLVLAAAPEESTAEGQTEDATENTVDDELTSEDIKWSIDTMKDNELTWKWWRYMEPLMECNEDSSPVIEVIHQVFHLD